MSEQERAFGLRGFDIRSAMVFSQNKYYGTCPSLQLSQSLFFGIADSNGIFFSIDQSSDTYYVNRVFVPPTLATSPYKEGLLLDSEHAPQVADR
jgi:hypothetical protein